MGTTSYSNTEKNTLSPKQICNILKACKKAGVAHLEFGELNITFRSNESNEKASTVMAVGQTVPSEIESESITQDELKIKQAQLEELHLTDPLAYEQMLMRGELEG